MTRLTEKQIAAIEFLALPKRGGLTYGEIAEKVGVDVRTLYQWRQDERFYKALTTHIVRNTTDRLPEIFDSIPDHIIRDGNAALFRTLLQAHGLLTDKVEVDTKANDGIDVDAVRARLAAWKASGE